MLLSVLLVNTGACRPRIDLRVCHVLPDFAPLSSHSFEKVTVFPTRATSRAATAGYENYDWVGSCKRLPCAGHGADAMYRISNEA